MRYLCPVCGGNGSDLTASDAPCPTCLGRAVVMLHSYTCPECDGKKRWCPKCHGEPVRDITAYTFPVREVPIEQIHQALVACTTGGHQLDEGSEVDAFALGVTLGLLKVSEDRTNQFGWPSGELFNSLRSGVLRLDDAGIWHFPDTSIPSGVLLVRHPTRSV